MPVANTINFTKQTLLQLPPANAGGRVTYHDAQVRGLQLLVTDRGTKSFYVRKKRDGRSRRLHLGAFPDLPIEAARRKAQVALGRHAEGADLGRQPTDGDSPLTLGDLYTEYKNRVAPFLRRPDKQEQTFRLYLAHWREKPVDQLTPADVERLHKDLAKRISPTTANIALKLLHTLYNRAIDEWRIWPGPNPARGVKKFRETSRDRFATPKEIPYLLRATALEPNRTIADAILTALFTGARRDNVQTMTWAQLDLDAALWRIPKTKNGHPQLIHLCTQVIELLRARRSSASSAYVFPGPGKSGHLKEVKSGWARVLLRAEGLQLLGTAVAGGQVMAADEPLWEAKLVQLPRAARDDLNGTLPASERRAEDFHMTDLRFQDLRRTHATWMLMNGAAKHLVGKQLNHRTSATTDVYARILPGAEAPYVDAAVSAMLAP